MLRVILPSLLCASLFACGGDDSTAVDASPVDASPVDAAAVDASPDSATVLDAPGDAVPMAATFTYVTSALRVPDTATEATMLGLDVDGIAGDANGGIDNQLGTLLGSLHNFAPELDVTVANATAIDRGELLLLARLGATVPIVSGPATLTFDVGANPMPSACATPSDAVCRRHLAGDGSFTLAPGVTPGTPLVGDVLGARFLGDGGAYVLPMTFGFGSPVVLVPVTMGASEAGASEAGLATGKLAGAIRQSDVEAIVHPALYAAFAALIDRDCPAPRTPPTCGCVAGSTGASLLSFLDIEQPRDCQGTLHELTVSFNSLLTPDIDTNTDGTNDAVSFGFGFTAVGATIRP